jgi:two-component system phosphate regulon sensor histidine kinase PhoR
LVVSILLISIAWVTSDYFENFLIKSWGDELKTEARLSADQLHYSGAINDASTLPVIVETLSETTNDRITVILPDGKVIGESEKDPTSMENHLARPEIQDALAGRITTVIRTSNTLHTRFLYAAAPVIENGEIVAVVRLAKPVEKIDAALKKYDRLVFYLSTFGILLCIGILLLQSYKKFNPLAKISKTIQSLSLGNLKKIDHKNRNDEIGVIISSFNSMVDRITLQIAALQEERKETDAILNNMKDGVILVDADGKVTLVNPAAQDMFNMDSASAIGSSLIEVVRHYQVIDLWKECKQANSSKNTLIQLSLDRDSIQASASPIEENLPGDVLLLFQDLSLLHKLQTVRQDFVSNVSHELRTPLASLKALVETLLDGALKDPKAADHFLQLMDGEIDNLTQIVQELLELSKIESGKVPLDQLPIEPGQLVASAVKRMQLQAERSGVTIIQEIPIDLPKVFADFNRIQQVLVNLLHNAIKFTDTGGTITISAVLLSTEVEFKVVDTGIGISKEDLGRIFERFYKSDRARATGGTGLGLSIARHIVEGHKGKIWAESIPGKGSTFSFTLPLAR